MKHVHAVGQPGENLGNVMKVSTLIEVGEPGGEEGGLLGADKAATAAGPT